MKTVALFDMADQSFTFFTDEEWAKQIQEWRVELQNHEGIDAKYMDVDEIVELTGGEEYFWDNIA